MRINKKSVQSSLLVAMVMAVSPICVSAEEMPAASMPAAETQPARTQPAGMPMGGPIPFFAFDKDDNGAISEEEFKTVHEEHLAKMAERGRPVPDAKNMPAFSSFDTDADGKLTRDELMSGQREQMKQMREKRMTQYRELNSEKNAEGEPDSSMMGRGMRMGRNMPVFDDFDLDKNGKINQQEFDEARGKRMAEKVKQGFPMRNAAKYSFADVDTNSDGDISKDELSDHQSQCRSRMHEKGMRSGQGRGQGRGMGSGPGMAQNMNQDNRGMGSGMGRGMNRGMNPGMDQSAIQERRMDRRMGRMMASFSEFDLDRDGEVVEKEFNEARNKRITERAQQGYQMRNAGNAPSFADFDANGDGAVSMREFVDQQYKHRQQQMEKQRQQWQQRQKQMQSQMQQ